MTERSEALQQQAVQDGSAAYAVEPEIATAEDVPPGYKRTEVGVIPEDWNIVSLVGQGKTYGGLTGKTGKDFGVGNARYVPFLGVMDCFFLDDNCLESVNVAPNEAQNSVNAGDILLTGSSETPEEVAMPALVGFNLPNVYLNSFCFGYRLNEKAVFNGRFLVYLISSETGREVVAPLAQGSTRHNISKKALLRAPLPCPPLHEQRAIAAALSDADALIASLDRLIAKKRAIKQAAMQQLLTGQTRLPGFTGEWETKRLGEFVDLKNGYAFKSTTYRDSAFYKIITISNVQDGYIELDTCSSINALPSDLQEHQMLSPGDILISMTGNVGRVCVVDRKGCLQNQRVGKVIPRSINKRFLFFLLHDRRFMHDMVDSAVGGAQGNIGKNDILGYSCLIPASIKEQTAIATALSDMDTEIEALERRRDKAREIKQGMMQQLLTGRVRLVAPEVAA